MSLLDSAAAPLTLIQNHNHQDCNRRSANFHPSIWGDYFLFYAADDSLEADVVNENILKLKEEIRRMLVAPDIKYVQKLDLIDVIQRLGISYHFETEVDEILEKIHKNHHVSGSGLRDDNDDDLHSISLQFRLLRQHGHKMSSDVFNKFKDNKGNFKESLVTDIKGILSLYEATHLRVHGEDILEEALAFTTSHLESMATQISSPLAEQVNRALNRPIRRGLQRLDARHYMSVYQEDPLHNKVLLTFAKLDFNILQKLHQKELSDISRKLSVREGSWGKTAAREGGRGKTAVTKEGEGKRRPRTEGEGKRSTNEERGKRQRWRQG
ncbi:hypothetical protein JRO89_XS15G0139500 [Xanthoceras sorbifolium]|uniref:Terpene synthase N-terminal domain-containing protein n=1 Tax=Xanthoceras sorbifolium TaxID=99658 RepID=A0ABQ8H275_9ROSI|nr:hypothetical protein JRO89_XS15G0139500 [Xanthoceras sorbifolium]